MRVLLTTSPQPAQFALGGPLGWAFQTAGHEVLVASEPSSAKAMVATGLATTIIGREPTAEDSRMNGSPPARQQRWPPNWPLHLEWLDDNQRRTLERVRQRQLWLAESTVEDLVHLTRRWRPALIIHDSASLAGTVAGSVTGIPTVSHLDGSPAVLRMELQEDGGSLLPRYSNLFTRFGVEPRLGPAAWVDPCPPSMALPAKITRLPTRFVPSDGPSFMPDWLFDPSALPRVCVSWSVSGTAPPSGTGMELFRQVLDAVTTLDADILLAIKGVEPTVFDTLPPRIRVVDSVPLHALLRSCDAVVHQGSAGTTLTAGACGTPQLIISSEPEQILNGDRLWTTGAGRFLLASELPAGENGIDIIGIEAARLLDRPSYVAAAQRLQAEIEQQPSPSDVACTLTDLVINSAGAKSFA